MLKIYNLTTDLPFWQGGYSPYKYTAKSRLFLIFALGVKISIWQKTAR